MSQCHVYLPEKETIITKAVLDSHIRCRLNGIENLFSLNFRIRIRIEKNKNKTVVLETGDWRVTTCRTLCSSSPAEPLGLRTAPSAVASESDGRSD